MREKVAEDLRQLTDWVIDGSIETCNGALIRGEDPPWEGLVDLRLARKVRSHVEASNRARETYEKNIEKGWRPKVPTVIDGVVYCHMHGTTHAANDDCNGRHDKAYVWMRR